MTDKEPIDVYSEIPDLEMIHWVSEKESMRGKALASGYRPKEQYKTYDDLYKSLEEHGPLVVTSSVVDVIFVAIGGEFDGHVMAIRQSGLNIRRFLIRSDTFEEEFGSFQNCLDHIRSNNAVGVEIELKHLSDLAEKLELDPFAIDPERSYDRLEIDVVAALQIRLLAQNIIEDDERLDWVFRLGFCVGRLFSSAQNLATLEPDARRAYEYEQSYRERGFKGKSKDRKQMRLDHLFAHIQQLVEVNPALSRMKPIDVAKLALVDASTENPSLWSQGKGQLEAYITSFASEERFRSKYRALFPKTG